MRIKHCKGKRLYVQRSKILLRPRRNITRPAELKRHLTVPAKHKNMPSATATQRPREPNIVQTLPKTLSRRPLCALIHSSSFSSVLRGWPLEVSDLFDQIGLLVAELLVLGAVVLELAEELDEFGLVLQQDVEDGLGLVRIGHKHLNA